MAIHILSIILQIFFLIFILYLSLTYEKPPLLRDGFTMYKNNTTFYFQCHNYNTKLNYCQIFCKKYIFYLCKKYIFYLSFLASSKLSYIFIPLNPNKLSTVILYFPYINNFNKTILFFFQHNIIVTNI